MDPSETDVVVPGFFRLVLNAYFPDAHKLPPTNQGGTEKVVHELTESLVQRGHTVTIFATRGSRTSAKLVPFPIGLRDQGIASYVLRKMPPGVDVIHDHTFTSALGIRMLSIPTVCTMHLPVKQRVNNRGDFVYNGN